MRDTPMVYAMMKFCFGTDEEFVRIKDAAKLERELNAANQRIKQLEAVVNDPEALWTNWLRGTVKLPSGIGDVRQYQDRIKRLEDWKEWALAVEREWNANAIATMLGGQPGESQREVIQREVPKLLERIKRLEDGDAALTYSIGLDLQKENEALKARIKRLEEAGKELRECASQLGWTSSEDPRWIERAEAAVEAWDKEAKP